MLDGGDDAFGGAGFAPFGGDDACEVGVFAEIFEVAAVDGDAADVDGGAELKVGAAARPSRAMALP